MFKPTDPKFDILMVKLKEYKDKKNNIDYEINELPWLYSHLDDLEKEIIQIDQEILSLINQKKSKIKEIAKLKVKLNDKNKDQMQKDVNLLVNTIQKTKKEIQKIVDNDFRNFINTMTDKNTITRYLSSNTSTTPIMDKFYNDKNKDFLVLRGIFLGKDLVITKGYNNVTIENIEPPTMTELKKFSSRYIPKRIRPLVEILNKYDNSKLKYGQKIQFDTPLPLGGQTYANQTGYGWDWTNGYGIEGTFYGETTQFFIIGFIKT